MPAKIFGAGVQDHVDAEFRRTLIDGRGEGAVDQRDEVVLTGERRRLLQIHNAQRGIGRRLQIKQFGVRANGARVLLVVGGVNQRGLDAQSSAANSKRTW